MDEKRIPTPLDAVAERWLDTTVELDPTLAVMLGRPGYEGRYADQSPAGFAARADAARAALAEVASTPSVDEVDAVTRLELVRQLGLMLELHDAQVHLRNVAVIESPVQTIRDVFDLEPTDTAGDRAAIAARLHAVPGAVDGYLETLREGIARGITPAARQVGLAADEAAGYAAPDGFFATFAEGLAAAATHRTAGELRSGATAAAEAYGRLAAFLAEDLAPVATPEDAVGRDLYSLASRDFVGATLDLDETYEWGLEELDRMAAEQQAVADRILPGASVEEAIAHLDADPARKLEGTAALQAWMQTLSDQAVASLGATHFDIPEPLRRLECRIAPTTSGVIYYTPPADDFSRPGRMWWSVPSGETSFATWRETTTVYHEGVPGHHLQLGTAVAAKDTLNAWRRFTGTSGHWEGWALYAERLMAQLGYLTDDADLLGMLDGQRMRAARVVVDIGVHLGKPYPGGGTWDYEKALECMRANVHMGDGFIAFEVHRYLGWPGQAPSYKVGQRVWEQVRDEARAKAGAGWDIKAFHKKALGIGSVGLDTLRTVLTA